MPELAFVLGSTASPSLVDLTEALAAEVCRQDAVACLVGELPELRPDRVVVVFDSRFEADHEPVAEELARSVDVVTAAPDSGGFAAAVEFAARAGAAFHVNSIGVERLLATGVPARHLQLGFSADWPTRDPGEDGLAVIEGDGYFAWVEALAAIHRGDVVLHERCLGMAPLVSGRHVFIAARESLDLVADLLRRDGIRLQAAREDVTGYLRTALPLAIAAAALIGAARVGVAQPLAAESSSTGQPAA